MKRFRIFFTTTVAVLTASLLAACDGDGGTLPSQRLDLVEVVSDADGYGRRLVLDSGDTLELAHPVKGFKSDTICRCLAVYRHDDGRTMRTVDVTSLGAVVTLPPLRYKTIYADSITVESAWIGGNYLNLRLLMHTKGAPHALGFANLGEETHADGSKTLHLFLYNNGAGDAPYFTRYSYLCCALNGVRKSLQSRRDTISLTANEYGRGLTTRKFPL